MDGDAELLEAWAQGDAAAGNAFVERYYKTIYNFLANKLDAGMEDLAQAIFLRCVEHRQRLSEVGDARAYLLTMARNEVVTHYRRKERAGFDPASVSVAELGTQVALSEAFAQENDQRALLGALRALPLDLQITVELHYWEDMPLKDIATITDVPEGTVKSRLSRARSALARRLGQCLRTNRGGPQTLEAWAREVLARARPPR